MNSTDIHNLAQRIQAEVDGLGLGAPAKLREPASPDLVMLYDTLVRSGPLRSATRKLFIDGHYPEAVEEAYKCFNNTVKAKVGIRSARTGTTRDGWDLMMHAFYEAAPVLKLNELRNESERNEQTGYKFIAAGCMTGIRNPRAHGHDLDDHPEKAIEFLAWANHLMEMVARSKRARKRKPKSSTASPVAAPVVAPASASATVAAIPPVSAP